MTQTETRLFPSDCRIGRKTYGGALLVTICRKIDNESIEKIKVNLENVPIMVKSNHCNLARMGKTEQAALGEESEEIGGYFIINGLEKLLRLVVLPKYNHPIGLVREKFKSRRQSFSKWAVQMKCLREDFYTQTISINYSTDGNLFVVVKLNKVEFLIPAILILKSLKETTDLELFNALVRDDTNNSFISDRVEILLRESKRRSTYTKSQCLSHLGFLMKRPLLKAMGLSSSGIDPNRSNESYGKQFVDEYILFHCKTENEKFSTLCMMIHKLYSMVNGTLGPDNSDSIINQSVLLPGHLYLMYLRERLENALVVIRARIVKDLQSEKEALNTTSARYIEDIAKNLDIGRKLEYLLATGNLVSKSGLDMLSNSGYAIIADKLNAQRFHSHFRSIHRGAFFTEIKTTVVRKLLPENWGFICPVHTPDGGLCGLLQHLSIACQAVPCYSVLSEETRTPLIAFCAKYGMYPVDGGELKLTLPLSYLYVSLDGSIIGMIDPKKADGLVGALREAKINEEMAQVPGRLGIALIRPTTTFAKQSPGVYIFSNGGRFTRPVKNLKFNKTEYVDPFEQSYLGIACTSGDLWDSSTHQELDPSNVLSELANQIPFLNHNQSPRTMYQCQMAKQTMGTPYHAHPYRFDNKVYRIIYPQRPMVQCEYFDQMAFGQFPSGTNAVVAVISNTGYDMEDAMIINKSSYERGFGHGSVYKSVALELNSEAHNGRRGTSNKMLFKGDNQGVKGVGSDGLPAIGEAMVNGSTKFAYYDQSKNQVKTQLFTDSEKATIDQIAIIGDKSHTDTDFYVKFRYGRNPIIGDKFSSRHGQKGVLAMLWPQIDMPFSESGICPDVLINPNAFPSRMTIGMLIESLAGKLGASQGKIQKTRSFQPISEDDSVKFFGEQLKNHGYNYYGTEVMYSGTNGEPFNVDIFMGVVYYQRLRHMVSDKSQARGTGKVDPLTHQPVKGRKRGGGIRLGEMERDAVIAHGASYCLRDRLLNCSDYSEGYVCKKCGSLISSYFRVSRDEEKEQEITRMTMSNEEEGAKMGDLWQKTTYCKACNSNNCVKIVLPYVLRYLVNELAAMNIKLTFEI